MDTTTRGGSVAVLRDDTVLAELSGDPAVTHGQRLPGDLKRALDAARVEIEAMDLLAVVAGPGSFTGLRVGIATAQGLAFARDLKIVPVSSLDALAWTAAPDAGDRRIAAWVDAQRGEVFASLFSPRLDVLAGASSQAPGEILASWRTVIGTQRILFTGDGASRYRDVIHRALGDQADIVEPVPLLAATAARIAASDPGRAVLPHAVVPIYVRRPDAELARERRHRAADRDGDEAISRKAKE